MKHFSEVCESYEYEKESASTGQIEVIRKMTDNINTDRSLLKFVTQFVSNSKTEIDLGADDDRSEDEDYDDNSSEDDDNPISIHF
jgi:hypothetical protein